MLLFITHAKRFISGTDTTGEPNIITTGVVKIKQVLNCTATFVIFSIFLRRYKMPQAIALRHNKSAKSQSTLLRKPRWRTTLALLCWFYILRKTLETCASMTFPDFRRLIEWCQLFYRTVPESLYIGYMGTILPMVPWYVANFGHLTKLTFNAILSAKPIWPDMTTDTLYVESLPTPWL